MKDLNTIVDEMENLNLTIDLNFLMKKSTVKVITAVLTIISTLVESNK